MAVGWAGLCAEPTCCGPERAGPKTGWLTFVPGWAGWKVQNMSQAHGLFAGPGRATVAKHSFTEFSVLCLVLFPKKLAPAWPMTSCLCCAFFVPVSGWAFFVLGRALSWPTAKYLLSLILRLICGDVKRLIKYWRGISFGCTGGFMLCWVLFSSADSGK